MEENKQIPLTKEEIDYINSKNGIKTKCISTYPQNNTHMEIVWTIPIKITRNEDEFWWNNYKESNIDNYWVVYNNSDRSEYSFEISTAQFDNIDDAINYAKKWYKIWLKNRVEDIENL